jgi:hypothetical protein
MIPDYPNYLQQNHNAHENFSVRDECARHHHQNCLYGQQHQTKQGRRDIHYRSLRRLRACAEPSSLKRKTGAIYNRHSTWAKADTEPVIRKCLAIGADDAIRVNAEPTDAYFVAEQIAAIAKEKTAMI